MPLQEIILPTAAEPIAGWPALRRGIKRCIKAGTDTARVYSRWPLKYSIGETVKLLRSKNDEGRIHAWMVSVASASPTELAGGGHRVDWNISLRIWGFMGYAFGTDDDNTQDILEEEARKISNILFLNRNHLGMENATGLNSVGFLAFEDIDVHGFGDKVDCHVAQGTLTLRYTEQLLTTT